MSEQDVLLEPDILAPDSPEGEKNSKQVIGLWQLFGAAFVTVYAPYGMEAMVEASGTFITLIGIVVIGVMMVVPLALMTAELSTMMTQNGGYIVWTKRAFGPLAAWVFSYNILIVNIFDMAIYPVLFLSYIPYVDENFGWWEKVALKIAIILLVSILNILGAELVGWSLLALAVAIFAPFMVFFFVRTPYMSPQQWIVIPKVSNINWGLYFATVIWMYAGWDDLGTLAGEVKDGPRSYGLGAFMAFVGIVIAYLAPLFGAFTLDTDYRNYHEGYFVTLCYQVGEWLGVWITVVACLSLFGLYLAALAYTSRAVWAMGRGREKQLPGIFGITWKRFNTPAIAILILIPISILLMEFDFEALVTVTSICNSLTICAEFGCLIRLRYIEPDTYRPFKIPGGNWFVWVLFFFIVVLFTAFIGFTPWPYILICAGVNVFFVGTYYLKVLWLKYGQDKFVESKFGAALCLCCNPQDDEDPELDDDEIGMARAIRDVEVDGGGIRNAGRDAEVQINAKDEDERRRTGGSE